MKPPPERHLALLELIAAEWRALRADWQPWGVWIRQYPALPPEADSLDPAARPEVVWFLDARGVRAENVWAWRRFYVVYETQPWCRRPYGEVDTVFGRPHQIGLAAFAPYGGSEEFYLETIWGALHGRGWRIRFDAEGRPKYAAELWVS